MRIYILMIAVTFSGIGAPAQEMSAITSGLTDFSGLVDSGLGKLIESSGAGSLQIEVTATCFARNLRSVANPVAKRSKIKMRLDLASQSSPASPPATFYIDFPAWVVLNRSNLEAAEAVQVFDVAGNLIPIANAKVFGNAMQINIPGMALLPTLPEADGNVLASRRSLRIRNISFTQLINSFATRPKIGEFDNDGQQILELIPTPPPPGTSGAPYVPYMAHDGSLTAQVYSNITADASKVEIHAAFPGEAAFCGGYFSPLALFFEKSFKQAQITARTDFEIEPGVSSIYWPKASDGAYFLALDRNKDGQINDGDELFGKTSEYKNGFDRLAVFDDNKDQVIDSKDAVYKDLRLWFDENENGKSEKSELKSLASMKVESISLKYDASRESTYGNRARARERSHFSFKKNGKKVTGEIVDLWFAPAVSRSYAQGH